MKRLRHTFCRIALPALLLFVPVSVCAQRISLKTNMLYWAAASPNLGLETRLSRHVTFNIEAMGNYLPANKIWSKAIMVTPEARWWFTGRPQVGHFVGIAGFGAGYHVKYDVKDKYRDYAGSAYGFGPTYGYSFVLGRRLSLEATVGVGIARLKYNQYKKAGDELVQQPQTTKWSPVPLKVGLSFVYILK